MSGLYNNLIQGPFRSVMYSEKYRKVFMYIGLACVGKYILKTWWGGMKFFRDHWLLRYTPINMNRNLKDEYGHWAVITGCTSGIGKAFAYELASYGVNLILISRRQTSLDKLSKDLEQTYDIATHRVAVDFSKGHEIYERIDEEIRNKEIGILVNNVGVMYSYPKFFLDVTEDKLWELINVNVGAATMMTHLVLPDMVARKKGAIINMASSASFYPTPQMTAYAATKEYLDYFSRALNWEYKSKGITVQSLVPFYVATRMTEHLQQLDHSSLFIPSASEYVNHALSTLGYTSRTTGYWPHTLQLYLSSLLPEGLWMWGATRLNNALRRQALFKIKQKQAYEKKSLSEMSESSDEDALSEAPTSTSTMTLVSESTSTMTLTDATSLHTGSMGSDGDELASG